MQVSDFNNIVAGEAGDLARNNLYSIEIFPPAGSVGGGSAKRFGNFYTGPTLAKRVKSLSYMAKNVTIPGKSVGTIDAKRFGPIYKVANDLIIDTVSMTFMCSADYVEHRYFDGWLSGIMGYIEPGTGASDGGNRQLYTLSYYEDYVGQVNIIPLDRQGGAAANIQLMQAYPQNVGPIEMAWGDTGEIANFTVTWAFKDWMHTTTDGWWGDSDDGATGDEVNAGRYKMGPKESGTAPKYSSEMNLRPDPARVSVSTDNGGDYRESPGEDGSRKDAYSN